MSEAKVTKSPQSELMGDGEGILVIDDLVDTGKTLVVGFTPETYAAELK